MSGFISTVSIFVASAALFSGIALAGADQHASIPNTSGGVFISCQNPISVVTIARAPDGTRVSQAGPSGFAWQHRLPPMNSEYDQYYVAPDGSAAVVALSQGVGNVYLVSQRQTPTVLSGAIAAVYFQVPLAMIVHTDRPNGPYNVSIYRVGSGDLVGNTSFARPNWEDFRQFTVRLSGDGRFYYYLDDMQRLQLRDAVTGKPVFLDAQLPQGIEDVLLRTRNSGYLIASGKLLAIVGGDAEEIQTPLLPLNLVESTDPSIQPVNFHFGWGVRDVASGEWLALGRDGEIITAGHGMAAVLESQNGRVQVYDLSGKSRLLRSVAVDTRGGRRPMCANGYGAMTYRDGQFIWRRAT